MCKQNSHSTAYHTVTSVPVFGNSEERISRGMVLYYSVLCVDSCMIVHHFALNVGTLFHKVPSHGTGKISVDLVMRQRNHLNVQSIQCLVPGIPMFLR